MRRLLCLLFGHAYPLEPEWLDVFIPWPYPHYDWKYRYRCKRCARVTDGPVLSRWQ